MHHIPLYGRVAWSSTYTWCTQKSRAADERQRVSDMPTFITVNVIVLFLKIFFSPLSFGNVPPFVLCPPNPRPHPGSAHIHLFGFIDRNFLQFVLTIADNKMLSLRCTTHIATVSCFLEERSLGSSHGSISRYIWNILHCTGHFVRAAVSTMEHLRLPQHVHSLHLKNWYSHRDGSYHGSNTIYFKGKV